MICADPFNSINKVIKQQYTNLIFKENAYKFINSSDDNLLNFSI